MISFQTDRMCGMCEEKIVAGDMAHQITDGKDGNNQTHFSCWAADKIERNDAHNEKLRKQIEQYPRSVELEPEL